MKNRELLKELQQELERTKAANEPNSEWRIEALTEDINKIKRSIK